jgi:Alkylmercury lyase
VRLAGGVQVWGKCGVDALGMPAMLNDAVIASSDPANGQPISVTVHNGLYLLDSPTAVVFLNAAAGDGPSAESCCNCLNFFTSPASAQSWNGGPPVAAR